jgi:hypothetical protein
MVRRANPEDQALSGEITMRIVTCVVLGIVTATLLSAQENAQRAKKPHAVKQRDVFASNQFFAKGSLGIIDPNLYIVVKSAKNELLLTGADKWQGQDASRPEVVIFFGGKIWSSEAMPDQFDLSKAVVISFEGDKVRFFDFRNLSGGYYRRPRAQME